MQTAYQTFQSTNQDDRPVIAIAATFTAEPIAESLSFWADELNMPAAIEFAPYNQIFQQLLDPTSLLSRNQRGVNLILLRTEDWHRFNQAPAAVSDYPAGGPASYHQTTLERNAQDLVAALKAALSRSTTPHILCFCPASPSHAETKEGAMLQQIEAWIVSELSGINSLYLIGFQEVQAQYPVATYYDSQRDKLGHIPFTAEFFTALGTALTRKIYAIKHPPHKVIVLDCDNTLWKGIVGEDGVQGIEIPSTWRAVQEFVVAQQQAGMLICLCSKNNEADVMQVFEQRQEMPLKLEHLVAWRINWLPKSENIKSLAAELNLGLDSFIFIDDNPVECAEVSANCPEVLTLQLPIERDMQQFLQHVWAFDRLQTTAEDAQRTQLYQQNAQRQRFQQQALTMDDFLAGLELTIDIADPTPDQLPRVAQLTQRTNQFNFTTIRRSEADIQQQQQAGMQCRAVTVRDRFGDYGLVGVMLFSTDTDTLHLDTFLLSCRVLGRGVEHEMMRYLAAYAKEHTLSWIQATYLPTKKNRPALAFLESIAEGYQHTHEDGYSFRLSIAHAAAVAYKLDAPQPIAEQSIAEAKPSTKPASHSILTDAQISKSQRLGRIAAELYAPKEVLAAMQIQRQSTQQLLEKPFVPPHTSTEVDLGSLWTQLLGVKPISITDNYFELGGTSLQAVELFAQIEQYFGKSLPLTTLLEAPTIEQLAKRITEDAETHSNTQKARSLVLLNSAEGTTPPLFLVHPGGGEVLLYRNLAQRLQSSTPVYGIKPLSCPGYPILQTQIPEMAAYYIKQIRAIQPEGPYLLGGFCAGGVIAFEMALQLQKQGHTVPLVALMNAADVQEPKWWEDTSSRIQRLKLPLRRWQARLNLRLYRLYATRGWQPPRFLQGMSVMSVYQQATNSYVPKTRFNGEVALFRSRETEGGNRIHLSCDPLLGWQKRATQAVKVHETIGGFHEILQEPHVKDLAEQLQSCINRTVTDSH